MRHERLEKVPKRFPILIGFVVPLLHPRHQIQNSRQNRQQSLVLPTLDLFHLVVEARQRLSPLGVVPTGPPNHRADLIRRFCTLVENEPLLGYIELTPKLPVRRFGEILGSVLRRYRNIAHLLGLGLFDLGIGGQVWVILDGVFETLQLPGFLPGPVLA